jgi:oxygen-dependent protoporphyrinogen oxidase
MLLLAKSMTNILDSLVVGAGISGLSLAHHLQKETGNLKILVTESQNRVGGNITTVSQGEFLWEEGPNSFAPGKDLLQLAVEAGLEKEFVFGDRKLPRYVYWKGELIPVPMSPPAMLKTNLLSFGGKCRALLGALGFVPPAMGAQLSEQGGEETVSQFFARHLGTEVMQRLVEPFVSGVYAGDPNRLSAAAAFSRVARMTDTGGGILAGAVASRQQQPKVKEVKDPRVPQTKTGELGSFKQGLEALPKAIAAKLGDAVKLQWRLTSLQPTENGTYIAQFATAEGPQQVETRSVTLTTPAYVAAELLESWLPEISRELKAIPYPPVACVVLAYPLSSFKISLKGFGNLIPRSEGVQTLGTIWASSLFPGRVPQGWQTLTSFIGGATNPEIGNCDETEIVEIVHQDISRILLGPNPPSPKVLGVHLWPKAIPQYNLGHPQRLERINCGLKSAPGLYLCSNYMDGVALGDCVRRGRERAEEIARFVNC